MLRGDRLCRGEVVWMGRAPEGSAGRQTTGRDLLAGLSRSTLAVSSSIAEPSGNPTAHDEQEPRQEEDEHCES
jgi:hypothetical protein